MNESWLDDPVIITGDIAFARTKWKHVSSLRAALYCEKIGGQPACLTLELADWPDCTRKSLTVGFRQILFSWFRFLFFRRYGL
jgi:hypothetical protein